MNNTDDNLEKILKKMGFTESQWDVYTSEVAKIESQGSGGYAARGGSGFHYDGKYQLGRDAKNDAIRLLKKLEIPVPKSLKTHESFYDDTEGSSRSDFRNSSEAQELAFAAFTLANHMSLSGSENYKNKAAKEKLEILGIAHNQGAGKTEKWLSDPKKDIRDGFGTDAKKYSNAIELAFAEENPQDYDGVEPNFTLDYDAQLEEVEDTKQVQAVLNKLGYDAGRVDGFWGEKTRDAIKKYQKAKGLETTGKLNSELISSLEADAPILNQEMAAQITAAEKVKSMIEMGQEIAEVDRRNQEAAAPIPVSKPDEGIMSVAEADSVPSVELLNAAMRDRIPEQEVASMAEGGSVQTGPKNSGEPTAEALASGLATLGRYGDDYMVHAAEGETVIPAEVLKANPGLKNDIFRQMQAMGIENPDRYVVGSGFNSINPLTGQPEFFFKKIFKSLKKILPMAAPIVGGIFGGPVGASVGSFLGSKVSGAPTKDALLNALISGGSSVALSGLGNMAQGKGTFFGGVNKALQQPFGKMQSFFGGNQPASLSSNQGIVNLSQTGGGKVIRPPINLRSANNPGPFTSAKTYIPDQRFDMLTNQGVGDVTQGNWFSNLGPLGKAGVLGGGALGLAGLSGAFDEEEGEEFSGDPQQKAYNEYLALSDEEKNSERGRALLRQSGMSPSYTAEQLAKITGITVEEAREYLARTYKNQPDTKTAADGGAINGPGTGTSDSIPALLSDGEFVMTADAVRGAGGGDRNRGAAKMYEIMHQFERVA